MMNSVSKDHQKSLENVSHNALTNLLMQNFNQQKILTKIGSNMSIYINPIIKKLHNYISSEFLYQHLFGPSLIENSDLKAYAFLGPCDSGKTHLCHFLINEIASSDIIKKANCILEVFDNTMSTNRSRVAKLVTIQNKSASIQANLLVKGSVVEQSKLFPMLMSLKDTDKALFENFDLNVIALVEPYMSKASRDFNIETFYDYLIEFDFTSSDINYIWSIIFGLLHLFLCLKTCELSQITESEHFRQALKLLNVKETDLLTHLTVHHVRDVHYNLEDFEIHQNFMRFIQILYFNLFNFILQKINIKLQNVETPGEECAFFDCYGYSLVNQIVTDPIQQLYINYNNEKLYHFFLKHCSLQDQSPVTKVESILDTFENKFFQVLKDTSVLLNFNLRLQFANQNCKKLLKHPLKAESSANVSFEVHHTFGAQTYHVKDFVKYDTCKLNRHFHDWCKTSFKPGFVSDISTNVVLNDMLASLNNFNLHFIHCFCCNDAAAPFVFDSEYIKQQLTRSFLSLKIVPNHFYSSVKITSLLHNIYIASPNTILSQLSSKNAQIALLMNVLHTSDYTIQQERLYYTEPLHKLLQQLLEPNQFAQKLKAYLLNKFRASVSLTILVIYWSTLAAKRKAVRTIQNWWIKHKCNQALHRTPDKKIITLHKEKKSNKMLLRSSPPTKYYIKNALPIAIKLTNHVSQEFIFSPNKVNMHQTFQNRLKALYNITSSSQDIQTKQSLPRNAPKKVDLEISKLQFEIIRLQKKLDKFVLNQSKNSLTQKKKTKKITNKQGLQAFLIKPKTKEGQKKATHPVIMQNAKLRPFYKKTVVPSKITLPPFLSQQNWGYAYNAPLYLAKGVRTFKS